MLATIPLCTPLFCSIPAKDPLRGAHVCFAGQQAGRVEPSQGLSAQLQTYHDILHPESNNQDSRGCSRYSKQTKLLNISGADSQIFSVNTKLDKYVDEGSHSSK